MLAQIPVLDAKTFYISPQGSNTNVGSFDAAWQTLDYALGNPELSPGDIIHLAPGIYRESAESRKSGSPDLPITIKGSGSGKTFISIGRLTISKPYYRLEGLSFDLNYLLLIGKDCNHILINQCEFMRGTAGILMKESNDDPYSLPNNVRVSNSEFHHPLGNAMLVLSGDNHLIESNMFRDNNGYDAIRVFGNNHVIRGNSFSQINSPASLTNLVSSTANTIGFGQKSFEANGEQRFTKYDRIVIFSPQNKTNSMTGFVDSHVGTTLDVTIDEMQGNVGGTFNDWTICYVPNSNHADIIQTFASSMLQPTKKLIFEKNFVRDCSAQWANLENDPENIVNGDWTFRNNIVLHSRIQVNCYIPDVKFYNNTIFDTAGYTVGIAAKSSDGRKGEALNMRIYNNLFIRVSGPPSGSGAYSLDPSLNGVADYNLITSWLDSGFSLLPLYGGTHNITASISPNAIFLGAEYGDFHLISDSKARGVGYNLSSTFNDDFNDRTRISWDLGALAYFSEDTTSRPPKPGSLRILQK